VVPSRTTAWVNASSLATALMLCDDDAAEARISLLLKALAYVEDATHPALPANRDWRAS